MPEAVLGRGGAGEVFRVRDRSDGQTLALKRLAVAEEHPRRADLALQFEREYHTLAQLAHPGIVAVHDYGVAEGMPYYTMELLDGSDLRELSPIPWRRACELLCDVASSLALLHSRRLVHRDLSPRNVRCTSDGRAKLIDFGAMAAMGRSAHVIGTPAYAAPELVNGQELDARADLYSLGALAYFTLTGQHAFRVRGFRQLRDAWRTRPAVPSQLAGDVPPELDALVMGLLSLDPSARPSSTAEVVSRLRALSGQPALETSATLHAYLTTPTLVGRGDEQLALRKRILRAVRGSGSSVLITGAAGTGRSRMLATLVLEAKLAGALVLSAAAGEGPTEDYGLLRRLVDELLDAAPELARERARPHAAQLARVLPALGLAADEAAADSDADEPVVQWLLTVSNAQPLCIAVDDLPRADARSAAVLARLATRAHGGALCVAATAPSDQTHTLQRALDQLAAAGARIALQPLEREQSADLLRSVFGDVANLEELAGFVHELAGGKPGSTMELAQHLVDRGIARFADGAWSLPYRLDQLALPSSYEQAVEQRFIALGPCARELTQLLSLVLPMFPLTLADQLELLAPRFASKDVFAALDELLRAQLVQQSGESYCLRDATRRTIVDRSIEAEPRAALHARLARHFEQRAGMESLAAYHLLRAGDWERGLGIYRTARGKATDLTGVTSLFGRSEVGASVIETLYLMARERGVAPADLYPFQKVLVQLAAVSDADLGRYADDLLLQLRRDSGWDDCQQRPDLPPVERVVHGVQQAQARYDAMSERERGLAPLHAVRELAVMVGVMSGVYARTADSAGIATLAPLLEPFVPLAPVIALLHEMVVTSMEGVVHASDMRERRARVIEQLAAGPLDGLDELTRQGAVHLLSYYDGLDDAIRANPSALRRADQLETTASFAPLAWQLRAVYYVNAGDPAAAEHAREQRELHALQPFDNDGHLICSMIYEIGSAVRVGDLVGIKRLLERLTREAARFPGWKLWHTYAGAVFESLRGDPHAALREIERVYELAPAIGHAACVEARSLQVELLVRTGQPERAVELGRSVLAAREQQGRVLNNTPALVPSLAHAETLLGEYALGAARLEQLITDGKAQGWGGLPLATMYSQRAHIALLADDRPAFEQYAALAGAVSEQLRHPGLASRLQRLVSEARDAEQPVSLALERAAELATGSGSSGEGELSSMGSSVFTVLGACRGAKQRADHALELLLGEARARGGYLLGITPGGQLEALAWLGVDAPDAALERTAQALLDAARGRDDLETQIDQSHDEPGHSEHGDAEPANEFALGLQPFLLRSSTGGHGGAPVAIVLLRAPGSELLRLPAALLGAVCDGLLRAGDLAAG